ncbi:hypothetical protein HK096_005933 [Nowakowskiella sp. JEL0078]|nr:hypothetical protein HK096_005933 [Nowakowskiella sp. JEL0078]
MSRRYRRSFREKDDDFSGSEDSEASSRSINSSISSPADDKDLSSEFSDSDTDVNIHLDVIDGEINKSEFDEKVDLFAEKRAEDAAQGERKFIATKKLDSKESQINLKDSKFILENENRITTLPVLNQKVSENGCNKEWVRQPRDQGKMLEKEIRTNYPRNSYSSVSRPLSKPVSRYTTYEDGDNSQDEENYKSKTKNHRRSRRRKNKQYANNMNEKSVTENGKNSHQTPKNDLLLHNSKAANFDTNVKSKLYTKNDKLSRTSENFITPFEDAKTNQEPGLLNLPANTTWKVVNDSKKYFNENQYINQSTKRSLRQKPDGQKIFDINVQDSTNTEQDKTTIDSKTTDSEKQRQLKMLYKDFVVLESKLQKINESREQKFDKVDFFSELEERKKFSQIGVEILRGMPNAAIKYDLETRIWRGSCYAVVEYLRLLSTPDSSIIEPTLEFLKVQETDVFEEIANILPGQAACRSIGYSGDISRYRAQFVDKSIQKIEWTNAERKYAMASFMVPSAGLYHNQLALIANQQGRPLFAIYYYLRSLTTRNEFMSAKESLLVLFNKISSSKSPSNRSQLTYNAKVADTEMVFMKLIGMLFSKIGLEFFEINLKDFSFKLLGLISEATNKKAGMVKNSMSESLILIDPFHEASIRWWFIVTSITLSIVSLKKNDETQRKQDKSVENAQTLLFVIMEIIVKAQKTRMSNFNIEYDDNQSEFTLDAGFVLIEIILMWIILNKGNCIDAKVYQKHHNLWADLSVICNFLISMGNKPSNPTPEVSELLEETLSPTDWLLRGFIPFRDSHSRHLFDKSTHIESSTDTKTSVKSILPLKDIYSKLFAGQLTSIGKNLEFSPVSPKPASGSGWIRLTLPKMPLVHARAKRVVTFAKMLSKIFPFFPYQNTQPYFSFRPNATIVSTALHSEDENDKIKARVVSMDDLVDVQATKKFEDGIEVVDFEAFSKVGLWGDSELDEGNVSDKVFNDLKSRREELTGLITEGSKASESLPIKIIPGLKGTSVVFDTNCYLSDFSVVQEIIVSEKWIVIVPNVVIAELRGISKKQSDLAISAKKALSFLESVFLPGTSHLPQRRWVKLQTSYGTYLHQLQINTEKFELLNIDEAVLKVLQLQRTERKKFIQNEEFMPSVLVTDDGNMRLKAQSSKFENLSFAEVQKLMGIRKRANEK